jgi:hypothetical protein
MINRSLAIAVASVRGWESSHVLAWNHTGAWMLLRPNCQYGMRKVSARANAQQQAGQQGAGEKT